MKYLTVNGKKYPAVFGLHALEQLSEHTGYEELGQMQDMFAKIKVTDAAFFVHACIENGCIETGVEPISYQDLRSAMNKNLMLLMEGMKLMQTSLEEPEPQTKRGRRKKEVLSNGSMEKKVASAKS